MDPDFPRLAWWTVLLVGLSVLTGCERPFLDETTPAIEVVAPDLSTVFTQGTTDIRVRTTSLRTISSVEINGEPMTYDSQRELWLDTLSFKQSLNVLVIRAEDDQGTVGVDTAYALYAPFIFTTGPSLPEPRGGHTATRLHDGSVLVTGGASSLDGPASADAFLLSPAFNAFQRLPQGLNVARTGHTASLLPDGRVLILGGSTSENVESVNDLVEVVEIYDPDLRRFEPVPFDGEPIRRAFHTAVVRTDGPTVFIDLYGGRGDIRYGPEPRLGTRRDLRTLRLQGSELTEVNRLASAPNLPAAIWGHTETPLSDLPPGTLGRYQVAGSFFTNDEADQTIFIVDYTSPAGILTPETPVLPTPRTRHAAALLSDGVVAYFGGRLGTPADALDRTEIYVEAADAFFSLPPSQQPLKRFGLTATKLASGRILLLGGFTSAGNSVRVSELFRTNLIN